MKNKFILNIAGKDYTMISTENEEYANSIANLVNEEINSIPAHFTREQAAVLTSIRIADESLKQKAHMQNMRIEIKEYIEETEYLRQELKSVRLALAAQRRL